MFSENGFLPVGKALKDWRAIIDEKFETEAASELVTDEHLGPIVQEKFEKNRSFDGPKLLYEDLFEYARAQCRGKSKSLSNKVFFSQLKKQEIYLFNGTKTLLAAPEILERVHAYYFYEEFWDVGLNEISEYTVRIPTLRHYISLPTFQGDILCFVDPYTWSIDLRGIDVLRERVGQIIDPIRLQAWLDEADVEADLEEGETSSDFIWECGQIMQLIDDGSLNYEEDETLTDASVDHYLFYLEYHFPLLKNIQLDLLRSFQGASLCVREENWRKCIEEAKATPYEVFRTDENNSGETRISKIEHSVAAEKRAVAHVCAVLAKEKWAGTTSELRKSAGVQLGERAWRRVLDEVRKDFPEISAPGRKSSKT